MGCGSSKTDGVNPSKRSSKKKLANNENVNGKENKSPMVNNARPKKDAEHMADLPGAVPESESELMPKPVSFEISAKDEKERANKESIIKKHPPKRLQKLEDQNEVTTQKILEKQMSAKERRTQHLQERIQSSKLSRRGTARSTLPPKLEPTIPEQQEA
ncbi:hypothetical protein CHUAL_003293 [Chamberlinius hualienensis]